MEEVLIYALYDPENSKLPRYIGSTGRSLHERFVEHARDARSRPKYQHHAWFNLVLSMGRTPSITLLERCDSQEQADTREKHWIAFFRPLGCLFNIALGGKGAPGVPRSEKQTQALIARNKRGWTEETRRKQIEIRLGVPQPRETVVKVQSTAGWKEAQLKLKSANEARKLKVYCDATGEVFESIRGACRGLKCQESQFRAAIKNQWRLRGRYWRVEDKQKVSL